MKVHCGDMESMSSLCYATGSCNMEGWKRCLPGLNRNACCLRASLLFQRLRFFLGLLRKDAAKLFQSAGML